MRLLASAQMRLGRPEDALATADSGAHRILLSQMWTCRFPRALVEDVIANACKAFVMHGRGDGHDMEVSGTRVHVGSGGAIQRVEKRSNRPISIV